MPERPADLPPPRPAAVACLVTAMLVFAWGIGTLAIGRLRLHVATWDLAIFDQACWLLSHGQGMFLTTRNMPIFEHHLNLWLLPLAVLYRFAPGPATLLVVQTLAATVAAIPLFALARRLTRSDAVATVWALLYLSYPPLGKMLLHDFHFEPLALPCFVTAILFAHQERWRAMAVWLALAAMAKEDVGLVIAGFGLGLACSGHRKVGAITAACGLGYTLVAMKLIMPLFAAERAEAFYTDIFFGHLGHSLPQVALSPILRPQVFFGSLFGAGNGTLLLALLAPFAGLSLLRPAWLLGALPTLTLNLVSNFFATHSTDYHYQGFVLPFVVCSAVGGAAWLADRLTDRGVRRTTALAVPTALAAMGVWLGPALLPNVLPAAVISPLRPPGHYLAVWARSRAWATEFDQVAAQIPPDAAVSATMQLLPSFSGRREAYYWPSPFVTLIPGFEAEADFDAADLDARVRERPVDWLAVQVKAGPPLSQERHDRLLAAVERSGLYERVLDRAEVRVYRRR